jgi:hypothetical protein
VHALELQGEAERKQLFSESSGESV